MRIESNIANRFPMKPGLTLQGKTVMSKQIPHCVRDDSSLHTTGIGVIGGGEAATNHSPSLHDTPSFRRSKATEESDYYNP